MHGTKSLKFTRYSCQILNKLGFSRKIFGKNVQISSFTKIRPLGGGGGASFSVRTDGQPAMTKLIVDFRNFSNEPKNFTFSPQHVFMFSCMDVRTNSDHFSIQH